jgi:hypothetical protein
MARQKAPASATTPRAALGNPEGVVYHWTGSMSEDAPDTLRAKLLALTGVPLADEAVPELLLEVVSEGGGVTLDLDNIRFKLLRRDGRFLIKKEDPRSQSTIPPPMRKR